MYLSGFFNQPGFKKKKSAPAPTEFIKAVCLFSAVPNEDFPHPKLLINGNKVGATSCF